MAGQWVCATCGTVGKSRRFTKGSIWIEIVLWCAFLIPGVIYSIWRMTTKTDVCRACGSAELVPASSPVGRKLIAEHGIEQPRNAEDLGRELGRRVRGLMS